MVNRRTNAMFWLWGTYALILTLLKLGGIYRGEGMDFFFISLLLLAILVMNLYFYELRIDGLQDLNKEYAKLFGRMRKQVAKNKKKNGERKKDG